jgi:uncharacterized protein (UPF0335 family)
MSSTTSASISNDGSVAGMQEMMAQTRRCHEENTAMARLCKRLKDEGHDIKAMKSAIKLKRVDTAVAVSTLQATLRYSGLLGVPVSPETLFDGMDFSITEKTQHGSDMWDAEEAGYQSGRHGVKRDDNPYQAGTELYVHWDNWWGKGKAALDAASGPNATEVRATRAPRRRQTKLDLPVSVKVADIATARKTKGRKGQTTRRRPRRGPVTATENGATVY